MLCKELSENHKNISHTYLKSNINKLQVTLLKKRICQIPTYPSPNIPINEMERPLRILD